ncbi:MAG: polyphosphate--glucose phosphotransferase [Gemmatimonadota bacterium]
MEVLGIDIGGTGIKGAPVDVERGELVEERFRLRTPLPATPQAVTETVAEVVSHFGWRGPVGCGFPAVVRHGRIDTAANISEKWIGVDARAMLEAATGCTFTVLNDADVAGMAEMRLGAGRGRRGVVLVLTLGTGIGSALFVDGRLVPNTEFGHLEVKGHHAESWAADSVRERQGLSWKKWARRLDTYLKALHFYTWPELIILGGGVSKRHEKFIHYLTVDVEVVPARLRNEAGIIGAAAAAVAESGSTPVLAHGE